MSIHWTKRPTYEEIIKDLEKDYKVNLPGRVALNFYDSLARTQFQQRHHAISTSQQNVDAARDHAMPMTTDDIDTSRHAVCNMQLKCNNKTVQHYRKPNVSIHRWQQRMIEADNKPQGWPNSLRNNILSAITEIACTKTIGDLQQHPKVAPKPLAAAVAGKRQEFH